MAQSIRRKQRNNSSTKQQRQQQQQKRVYFFQYEEVSKQINLLTVQIKNWFVKAYSKTVDASLIYANF